MDRKSIVILVLSFVLILFWPKLIDQIYPRKPLPAQSTNVVLNASNQVANAGSEATAFRSSSNAVPTTLSSTNASEELLVVTNEYGSYTFTSQGGGIKLITLKGYRETIESWRTKTNTEARWATLNTKAPIPIMAFMGDDSWDESGSYKLSRTANGVIAEKGLAGGLVITKNFSFDTNFLLHSTVRIENRSTQPVKIPLQQITIGTATPMNERENGMTVGALWNNGAKSEEIAESWFQNKTLIFFPGEFRPQYQAGQTNVHWAAVHNQFFTIAAISEKPALHVYSKRLELTPPPPELVTNSSHVNLHPIGYQTALVYPATILAAGQVLEHKISLYAGPKEYNLLARIGDRFKTDLDQVMGFGFFGFFSKALLLSMNGLHSLGLTYGLAIVVITIIIKILFWPLTNVSTKSMKRMQELQPEIKKLQEKYKDDPQKLSRKQMEFYKENKINPVSGCLPMLLQIPVFFGFYRMLQSAIELRGASFLWAGDLSQPDTILLIPFLGNFPLNPLPLLMGVTMLYQAHITPPAPSVDPMQQKIMKYMPLMMMVFLYNMSAGLTLYWTVQNILTIVQTKMTKTSGTPTNSDGKAQVTIIPPKKKARAT